VISPAPALRNAVLDATGVAFHKIPLYPQMVFEKFKEMGLLSERSADVQHLSSTRA
jgi:xanthine dehydrogenase molybdenum-binding subunit